VTDFRCSQVYGEIWLTGAPDARITVAFSEVWLSGDPAMRCSTIFCELWRSVGDPAAAPTQRAQLYAAT
jgi:hypothetical protein